MADAFPWNGWPWRGSGTPPSECARAQLALVDERRLRALIRKAREQGGVVRFRNWEFSVSQLTAALKKSDV